MNQSCREMTQGNDKTDFRRKNQDKHIEDRISLDHATVDGEKSLRKFLHNIVTMTSDPLAMDRAAMGRDRDESKNSDAKLKID